MRYHRHTYYSDMVGRKTLVYRCFDQSGQLLYVGLTMNPAGRFSKHRQRAWWADVDYVTETWCDGREAAKTEERRALMTERPKHNLAFPRGAMR